MTKPTILCVDDEPDNVDALERLLRDKYKVLKAKSGMEGLELLNKYTQEICVIITDQRMPAMTGSEFLEKSLEIAPQAVRLLLTGYTDIESVIEAVNKGQIYRYLNKPWDPVDLVSTVDRAAERFQLQDELKKKNIELNNALSELKTLDQAKDQFMILINHELKTPLTSILSYGELLAESELNDEQKTCVKRIRAAGDRLRRIVDDVLLVLKVETRTLKMAPKPFVSTELLKSLPRELSEQMLARKISLDPEILEKKIVADASLIQQVFTRLIHNAVKFGSENQKIRIRSELTSPHRCKFSVFNSGENIPENVLNKITRPFFLDENIMNHSSGMGLGLTICHAILKIHQSNFKLENLPGGVQASFELPCL